MIAPASCTQQVFPGVKVILTYEHLVSNNLITYRDGNFEKTQSEDEDPWPADGVLHDVEAYKVIEDDQKSEFLCAWPLSFPPCRLLASLSVLAAHTQVGMSILRRPARRSRT